MKRRDFLKLAAGALASLGLCAKAAKTDAQPVRVMPKYIEPSGENSTSSESTIYYTADGDTYWRVDAHAT